MFSPKIFEESICSTPVCWIHGNRIIAHVHEVNSSDYTIVSITGTVLCNENITIYFSKMIHQIIKTQETGTTFWLSAENLTCSIGNAIYIDVF